ncbi:hypothetical protein GIB67_012025 [Kingdonia uniflora]|uniref:Hexosyltransferase n=1 Tax=Kingdonia uniflora TaxID=39325 RepID=A0A7J7M0B7_9MAGN|nr:hypothetical protein GIB67_012025 [Kingdonia uniflora]
MVMFLVVLVGADMSDITLIGRNLKGSRLLYDCEQCRNKKELDENKEISYGQVDNHPWKEDIDIIAIYADASGTVQINTAKKDSSEEGLSGADESSGLSAVEEVTQYPEPINLVKLMLAQKLKWERKERRTAELIQQNKEAEHQMQAEAIEPSQNLNTTVRGKYSLWKREYGNPNADSALKLMQDQIIMAETYGSIAKTKNKVSLYDSLMKHIKDNQHTIGEASSDAQLNTRALDRAKAMGHILSLAKGELYDLVARKLQAMLQLTEENINALKKKSAFLIQLAAKTVPKLLHCLSLQLSTDYFVRDHGSKKILNIEKLEDMSLYHYAIFSDNVLATSVVINSTVLHAKESEKHIYLPEVYLKLDKILFLDDDIVVQKDLTPLWSVDMQGMVNDAVETCKESFHRFDKYLNFSNPKISQNFDPNACGWAFGINIFDLKEWKKRDITGIYHHWQDMNEDCTLWKLESLPPGLITFYNLTYPLDRGWHVLGQGYDPTLNQTEIENAGVVLYNGYYKPWLDLAVSKYKVYWSKYVMFNNPYLQLCNISE